MEFNRLIIERVYPLLKIHGFQIAEEFDNIVRFRSPYLKMNISFNTRDRSRLIEIGRPDEDLFPVNDLVVKEVFKSELSVENVASEVFIQHLLLLFGTGEGAKLLTGMIDPLEQCIKQQSALYTSEILQMQSLQTASDAWERSDHQAFIDMIDKIGVDKVLPSYQQQYKIAKQKLSS